MTDEQYQPPDRLWLQWDGDVEHPGDEMRDPYLNEVTWSKDRVYKHDIEYVRAESPSRACGESPALRKAVEALREIFAILGPEGATCCEGCEAEMNQG